MRRGGTLLATSEGPASGSLQGVEDEDEFENEDDLVAATPRKLGAMQARDAFSS